MECQFHEKHTKFITLVEQARLYVHMFILLDPKGFGPGVCPTFDIQSISIMRLVAGCGACFVQLRRCLVGSVSRSNLWLWKAWKWVTNQKSLLMFNFECLGHINMIFMLVIDTFEVC